MKPFVRVFRTPFVPCVYVLNWDDDGWSFWYSYVVLPWY